MGKSSGISIYIHIPYCASKCHYCDFISCVGNKNDITYYIKLLQQEIFMYKEIIQDRSVETVFFGGGTPSLIPGEDIKELLNTMKQAFDFTADVEISLEANPGQLDADKLFHYRESSINRISFGLQALQDPLLNVLGRNHNAEDFYRQIESAKNEGFSNINADIIFGIPGQEMDDWLETICCVAEMNLSHLSCYGLTFEKGTSLYQWVQQGIIMPMDEDLEWKMFRTAIEQLPKRGYSHYEISNYSRPGEECRHNLTYWNNAEYLGLGVAAHGYLNGRRYENTAELTEYKNRIHNRILPVIHRQTVSPDEYKKETMFLGLRLIMGISVERFRAKHGVSCLDYFKNEINELVEQKLLWIDDDRIKLTDKGLDLANQVFAYFV
ncbi:MAG: radical SAM family heme chaperone HemW [Tindallia sp. MSAO_Bac2]|nr:MAG: radical SAM family heme chaperone HemW [Tindallia sp. MSAO_Bac2]